MAAETTTQDPTGPTFDYDDVPDDVLEAAGLSFDEGEPVDPESSTGETDDPKSEEKPEAEEKPESEEKPEAEETEAEEKPEAEESEETEAEETDEPEGDEFDKLFPDPEDETEKGKAKWGDLKKTLRSKTKELETTKAELEQLKSSPSGEAAETISTLTKELEELKGQLFVTDFTKSPEYMQEIQGPLTQALDDAKMVTSVVENEDITDPKTYSQEVENALLSKNWGTLKRLIEPLDEMDRSAVIASFNEVKRLSARHDALQAEAQEKAKEFEQAKTVESQQKQAEALQEEKRVKAQVREKLEDKIPFLTDEDGSIKPAFKAILDEVDKAPIDEQALPVKAAAQYSVRLLAGVVQETQKAIAAKDAKIAELQAAIKDTERASPGAGEGGGGEEPVEEDTDYSKLAPELEEILENPEKAGLPSSW